MADPAQDVEAYAALAVELAHSSGERAAILAAHGLDEERWEAIDDAWQERLSRAVDEDDDAGGVPPLVAAHAAAFVRAQRSRAAAVVPFERFVEATCALRGSHDVAATLRKLELSLEGYLRAQSHWTAEMLADDALAARLRAALG